MLEISPVYPVEHAPVSCSQNETAFQNVCCTGLAKLSDTISSL